MVYEATVAELRDGTYLGFDCDELRSQFGRVCDQHNWKNAVRCAVAKDDLLMTLAAIEFMTGSRGSVIGIEIMVSGDVRVLVAADGYYAACGA